MSPARTQELSQQTPYLELNPEEEMREDVQEFLESLEKDESDLEITDKLMQIRQRHVVEYEQQLNFSKESGYYEEDFNLSIETTSGTGHEIFYTLDGSIPTIESLNYQKDMPIEILANTSYPFQATVVRARSFDQGMPTSTIYSKSYLVQDGIRDRFTFPVISLITDPANLYDYDTGIYVRGANYDPSNSTWSGNWFMSGIDWERDVHIQYFTTSGTLELDQAAGMRIHGGIQRNAPQKTLRLYARSEYGEEIFNYRLLPQKQKSEYKRFLLRTSYGCWNYTVIKDPLAASLLKGLGFNMQDYRPVIVFINGDYWGIQTIRDYLGKHHLAHKYHLEKDSINIGQDEACYEGNTEKYLEVEEILDTWDLTAPETLHEISEKLDLNSTINYYNSEIYLNNYDWPAGNRRWWNTYEYDRGSMRWLLFDLDATFNARGGVSYNMLHQATVPTSSWPNPPNRTKLISSLLQNPIFRSEFITRAAYLMNYHLHADTIIPKIYRMKAKYAPEMPEHIERWNYRTMSFWESAIESALVSFSRGRRTHVTEHYTSKFGLSGSSNLTLLVNDPEMGQVYLNDMPVPQASPTGEYFRDVPIRITAVPKPGFAFSHWNVPFDSYPDTLSLMLSSDTLLKAFFVPSEGSLDLVKINELMAKNTTSILDNYHEHEDWIEIFNGEDFAVDLAGFYLSDDRELPFKWKISERSPEVSTIQSQGFLVLFADNETRQGLRHCGFKLNSSGETLSLVRNLAGIPVIIDSLSYGALSENQSWGRAMDGCPYCIIFKEATPGASNELTISVEESPRLTDIRVYPNPSNERIKIELGSVPTLPYRLNIFNMAGYKVKSIQANGSSISLEVSDLAPGIYLIRVEASFVGSYKLVIQ